MHFKEKYSLDTLKVCYVHIHDGRKPFGIYLKALTPLYMGSEDMQVLCQNRLEGQKYEKSVTFQMTIYVSFINVETKVRSVLDSSLSELFKTVLTFSFMLIFMEALGPRI